MTVNEMLKRFTELLNDSFTAREKTQLSRQFLMQYMNLSTSDLLLNREKLVPKEIISKLLEDIEEINQGKPTQYVLGTTYFYDLELVVDERALIPRPETEELVDWIIEKYKGKNPRILDVGTGTGCIALALKNNLPNATVVGVDVEEKAVSLAKENAKKTALDVGFMLADALNLTAFSTEKWDVIVSNPPYIPQAEEAMMKAHVLDYEPASALFVPNEDPLLFYKAISLYAKEHLNSGGSLFFEIHEGLGKGTMKVIEKQVFKSVELKQDLQSKDRMIHAQL